MSCVRELKLKKKGTRYLLVQQPVEEMQSLRKNEREMRNIKMGAGEEWTLCNKVDALELLISYPTEKINAPAFGIRISTGMGKQFEITFCKNEHICYVDRTNSGRTISGEAVHIRRRS